MENRNSKHTKNIIIIALLFGDTIRAVAKQFGFFMAVWMYKYVRANYKPRREHTGGQ